MIDKNEEYEIYEKIFKNALSKNFHEEDNADVSVVAIKNFLLYSASVILERAIPDLRDGLKPSQRRALYVMKKMGLSYTGSYKKSARITGTTIGLYHPHGDLSVYETMLNLSQPWKQNLPLIEGQGNWGSIDGDSAASQRYTEARLTKASVLMFNDIDKNTVDFQPNYDGLEKEPVVLPSPIPMILINGVLKGSIAVGMDSVILPHNTNEVMSLMLSMIQSRKDGYEFTSDDFLKHISAPDLPTGGIIYNLDKFKEVVENGKGSISVRANYFVEKERGKESIIINEIPYGKLKSKIIEEIVSVRTENKANKYASAISNITDQSTEDMRIVIDLKKGYDADTIMNYLYSKTSLDCNLQYRCTVIDTVDNKAYPREYGLLEIMNRFLDHRFDLTKRKYTYILNESENRLHILEGLIKCIDIIDDVIHVIKKSRNPETAIKNLIENFKLTEIQARAILNMRLSRLTSMQKKELIEERKSIKNQIKECKLILENFSNMCDLIYEETKNFGKDISVERRSVISQNFEKFNEKEIVVPVEDILIQFTNNGYIKKVLKKDIELTDGDFILKEFNTNTHANIYVLSSTGQLFSIPTYDIPDSYKGSYIGNIVDLDGEIISVFTVEKNEDGFILFSTKNGLIKKTDIKEFSGSSRKSGVKAIGINNDDEIISAEFLNKDSEVLVVTSHAKSIRYSTEEVSNMGRTAKGVRSIKLKDDDFVVYSSTKTDNLYCLCDDGEEKKIKNNKIQKRGGVGILITKLLKRNGNIKKVKYQD